MAGDPERAGALRWREVPGVRRKQHASLQKQPHRAAVVIDKSANSNSLNQDGGNEQVSVNAWAASTLAPPGMFAGGAYRTITEVPSLSSNIPGVNVYPFMVAAVGLT